MAATISGFSGFGFALIAVPILTIFLDVKSVVPLEVVLALFCLTILSIKNLQRLREPAVIYLFVGMVAGIAAGAWALDNLDAGVLKKILGCAVILFAVHIFKNAGRERELKNWDSGGRVFGAVIATLVGVVSGVAGGMFGTSGPPLVVYVDHFAKDKTAFRAQIVVLILFNNIVRVIMYTWGRSILTMESVKFAVWLLPAVILGLFLGSKMHFQVSEKTFGRAIAVMLFVSGLLLIIRP
jgi:uncharacterized membrane protein YfcA